MPTKGSIDRLTKRLEELAEQLNAKEDPLQAVIERIRAKGRGVPSGVRMLRGCAAAPGRIALDNSDTRDGNIVRVPTLAVGIADVNTSRTSIPVRIVPNSLGRVERLAGRKVLDLL